MATWVGKGDEAGAKASVPSARLSSSVQGTPRRGNEHVAQGIALGGYEAIKYAPEGQKRKETSVTNKRFCPCRAHLRWTTYPGRCPGLCARWAFSPLLERLMATWVGKGDEAGAKASVPSARLSSSVQGTPRRGNEHVAQGIALGGYEAIKYAPEGQKRKETSVTNKRFCPCRAHLRWTTYPGRCPGLCARWAFSPLLERLSMVTL